MAAPCPFCQNQGHTPKPVRFTPWGGVIGPRIFSLVKCSSCGGQYNGKSGQNVDKHIRIYTLLTVMTLALVAAWAIYSFVSDNPTAPTRQGPAIQKTTLS